MKSRYLVSSAGWAADTRLQKGPERRLRVGGPSGASQE